MKKTVLIAVCLGLSLGAGARASETMEKHDMSVLANEKTSMQDKVKAIDDYVRHVEKNVPSMTRKEAMLSPDELKNVTDEKWSKIHTYSKDSAIMRMKMYPEPGSKKTEEFYYHDSKPIFVFLEENGADKENHDANAKGEKFYFGEDGKLIAALDDAGKEMDLKSAATEKMAEKLMKESTAFRAAVK